jgi:hypothetical protein
MGLAGYAESVTHRACAGPGAAGDGVRTSANSATHVAWPQVYILGLESRATNFESTQCAPQARQSMHSLRELDDVTPLQLRSDMCVC